MGNAGIISSTVSPKVEASNQNGEGLTGGSFSTLPAQIKAPAVKSWGLGFGVLGLWVKGFIGLRVEGFRHLVTVCDSNRFRASENRFSAAPSSLVFLGLWAPRIVARNMFVFFP